MRDLPADTVVDQRYSIVRRIGSGGMADVYLAQDRQLGRKVALKLLYRRFAQDADFVERFKREASSAAGLQHPHVVGVYDRGEWDGTYYIAMEYLEGRSLKQVLQEEGTLPPDRAIDVVVQILQAARFAHQRGIVHRDIKPHNVIVDDEGRAKVTDFGIARAGASDMTETGSIMGTAQYLSPEQAQGHSVGPSSDLYAIGILLYELLAGRVPFDGDSPVTIALKQVSELPVPPSAYNPSVPPELDAIVLHALEKEPERRFADADEFIAALERARAALVAVPTGQPTAAFGAVAAGDPTAATVLAGAALPPAPTDEDVVGLYPEEPLPPEDEEERRRRRTRWLIAGAVILLLLLAGLAFFLTRPDKVKVPDVVGKDYQAARIVLVNAGFHVQREGQTSPTATKDRVLREDPQPNSSVDKGSTITLTVSDGPGTALIPDVTNLTVARAREALEQQGFKVAVQREPSDTFARGRVTRTSPPGGTQIERQSTVTLFVSSGPAQVVVPNVTGQNEASASAELSNVGLKADVTEEESQETPGTVLRQSPAQGTKVAKGSTVTIVVAKEPTKVAVANVVGEDQASASSTLSAQGLTVVTRTTQVTDEAQDGLVQSQDPTEGTRVAKGTRVTIFVGQFTTATTPGGTGGNPGQ
jgi:eukaryotic-like serine/threonine-protein kinase